MTIFQQAVASGLVNGAVYVLVGLGLVLYFRSSGLVNLAHGGTYVVAALVTAGRYEAGWPIGLAAVTGVVTAVVFMVAVDWLLVRSRTDWPTSSLIILTLGIALLVEGVALRAFGSSIRSFPSLVEGRPFQVGEAVISRDGVATLVVALVAGIGASVFFRATVVGQAMTAAAENRDAAQLAGINVLRLRTWSFAVAATLGGLTAVLVVPQTFVTYDSGLPLVLRGFIVAGLAAMYWPERVVVGGLALGIVEALVGAYWDPLLREPIIFGVVFPLVVLLLNRTVRFAGVSRA